MGTAANLKLKSSGMTMAQELGVRLEIGGLPVRSRAPIILAVVSLDKTPYLVPTGGGHSACWLKCPAGRPLSVLPLAAVAITFLAITSA